MRDLENPPRRHETNKPATQTGFTVVDAPWSVPDTASTDDFPTFGSVVQPKASHAWGPKPGSKR